MKTNFEAICKQELRNLKRNKQGNKQRHFEDVIEQLFTYNKPTIHDDLDEIDVDILNFNLVRKKTLCAEEAVKSRKYSQDGDSINRDLTHMEFLGKRVHRKSSTLEDILDKP
jgi:hypothetical protein